MYVSDCKKYIPRILGKVKYTEINTSIVKISVLDHSDCNQNCKIEFKTI